MVNSFWQGRKVFLTGHTGFKGSWMSLWLEQLGADLMGYALPPHTSPSLFAVADVAGEMTSVIGDLGELDHLQDAMLQHQPEIVFHLAAQSLVRASYQDPIRTYETNVLGTARLLEAVRACGRCAPSSSSPPTNATRIRSGSGPTAKTIPSAATIPTATARPVRNWSPAPIEILFSRRRNTPSTKSPSPPPAPATSSAAATGPPIVSSSTSFAPSPPARRFASAIPMRPGPGSMCSNPCTATYARRASLPSWPAVFRRLELRSVLPRCQTRSVDCGVRRLALGDSRPQLRTRWQIDSGVHPHEANMLTLDWTKASQQLGWQPVLSLAQALDMTLDW